MQTVQELIDKLAKLDPALPIYIRDEIDILRNTNGNYSRKGIYEDFEVLSWMVDHDSEGDGNRVVKGEPYRFASISFNDKELSEKLTKRN